MKRNKINQSRLAWLIRSYLILTLILGLHSFFRLAHPTSNLIFLWEIAYLILSFILVAAFLVRLNLFLLKIKRNNFQGQPLKFQLHSLNFWFIVIWTALLIVYGFQSGGMLFGDISPVAVSFLNPNLFKHLITMQFVLINYLLISALVIFIYAIILYQQNGLKIKIIPNNFGEFDCTCLVRSQFFNCDWKTQLFTFINYFGVHLVRLKPLLDLLNLELKHRKTLALRQFKKQTTPPALFIFN